MAKITIEFDTWDEMEAFRTSGKKTRGKGQRDEEVTVEEVTAKVEAANTAMAAQQPQPRATVSPGGGSAARWLPRCERR